MIKVNETKKIDSQKFYAAKNAISEEEKKQNNIQMHVIVLYIMERHTCIPLRILKVKQKKLNKRNGKYAQGIP